MKRDEVLRGIQVIHKCGGTRPWLVKEWCRVFEIHRAAIDVDLLPELYEAMAVAALRMASDT